MSTVHQNGTTSVEEMKKAAQAPRVGELRTVSWSESLDEGDLEVPGTPKGPRTSTTPGTPYESRATFSKICHFSNPAIKVLGACTFHLANFLTFC
jgi:hypothetical protein